MGSQSSKPAPLVASPLPVLDEKRPLAAQAPFLVLPQSQSASTEVSSLTQDVLDKWFDDFEGLSRLVLSKADPVFSLSSRSALIHDAKVFNLTLKGTGPSGEYPGPRTNQASSGRCWLFATTNVLRYNVIETLKLGEFELSQSYLFFYDKLEKANYYLENALDLLDEPLEGRLLSFLSAAPINDGGQWDMAVNIIEKYGIIPKTLYPESFSSSASARLDSLVTSKLREYALRLRAAAKTNDLAALRRMKGAFMSEVFTTLSIALGSPPKPEQALTWEYYDRENKFHAWAGSPRDFYAQFGKRKGMDPKESFSLINDPRNEYDTLYSVERLGNVFNGRPVKYVNAPITALEDAVIAGIKANTPLFFGCDVGKSSDRVAGVMDCDLYDLKSAYGYTLGMDKAQRLLTGESAMTHAMVITAVHLDPAGRPAKYKVENSWSDAAGEKGWFMMTAAWFREYVFQVVVPRSVAEKKYVEVYDKGEAVMLKPWDPMGALA